MFAVNVVCCKVLNHSQRSVLFLSIKSCFSQSNTNLRSSGWDFKSHSLPPDLSPKTRWLTAAAMMADLSEPPYICSSARAKSSGGSFSDRLCCSLGFCSPAGICKAASNLLLQKRNNKNTPLRARARVCVHACVNGLLPR